MLDSAPSDAASAAFSKLLAIMAKLRDPNGGCPWDLDQSFRTIVPHTIEEAYEVADAIEQDDMESLKGELGDLLFQAVFYAQMAREAGTFTMADVLEALNAKMIKRHPHVFGDLAIADAAEQTHAWERQKAEERAAAAAAKGQKPSALDGVTGGLPALTRAVKLQNRAARVGFDWPEPAQVLDKIAEETAEIRAALEQKAPKDSIAEEIGDLLFAVVNLARHLEIDSETALRTANRKFERRFRRVEEVLAAQGKEPAGSTLDEMEAAWTAGQRRRTVTNPMERLSGDAMRTDAEVAPRLGRECGSMDPPRPCRLGSLSRRVQQPDVLRLPAGAGRKDRHRSRLRRRAQHAGIRATRSTPHRRRRLAQDDRGGDVGGGAGAARHFLSRGVVLRPLRLPGRRLRPRGLDHGADGRPRLRRRGARGPSRAAAGRRALFQRAASLLRDAGAEVAAERGRRSDRLRGRRIFLR